MVGVATLIRALFLRDVIPERYAMHLYRRHIVAAVITGATTGFVIGLTSAGSGTLIAIVLIAVFRLTPQRVVGTDVFHAAILLWAAGLAHWVGGNVDFGLAANILVGSIPGVLIGSQLAVKVPTGLLRNALGRRADRLVDHADHQGARAEGHPDPLDERRRARDRRRCSPSRSAFIASASASCARAGPPAAGGLAG